METTLQDALVRLGFTQAAIDIVLSGSRTFIVTPRLSHVGGNPTSKTSHEGMHSVHAGDEHRVVAYDTARALQAAALRAGLAATSLLEVRP